MRERLRERKKRERRVNEVDREESKEVVERPERRGGGGGDDSEIASPSPHGSRPLLSLRKR